MEKMPAIALDQNLKMYSLSPDSNGIFAVIECRRRDDHTLYMKSTLSNVVSGNYETMTWQYYDHSGTTPLATVAWTLKYDADRCIISVEGGAPGMSVQSVLRAHSRFPLSSKVLEQSFNAIYARKDGTTFTATTHWQKDKWDSINPAASFESTDTAANTPSLVKFSTGSGWANTMGTIQGSWLHAFGDAAGAVKWGYDGTDLKVGANTVLHAGNHNSAGDPHTQYVRKDGSLVAPTAAAFGMDSNGAAANTASHPFNFYYRDVSNNKKQTYIFVGSDGKFRFSDGSTNHILLSDINHTNLSDPHTQYVKKTDPTMTEVLAMDPVSPAIGREWLISP